jgi:ectoine hydroxylase-related dioxygenase (phytanoyl-CoA dioxygenase family)
MADDEREAFERDGYLVIRAVLSPQEVETARDAILGFRAKASTTGATHQLSAVTSCPELAFLLDHPVAFRYIWSILGWNVHVYHSHIDVHPQIHEQLPPWWHWHQDGGRQNRELETDPRPRLSVKLAYWLSDLTETGRGNFTVLPGSHKTNWLPGPPGRGVPWPPPEGTVQVTASPGDLVVFDRRLWHARSDNYSPITRVGAFFGYTYRWVAGRDDVAGLPATPHWDSFSPVQRQLLGHAGDGSGDHAWGHDPATTPLYGMLGMHGLLDSSIPALIP